MSALLWVLQVVLALHTGVGAVWKVSHSAGQTMPSLDAIPHGIWLALIPIELLCSLGLVLPAFHKPLALAAPIAATCVAAEMLLFCGVHLASGATNPGPMTYWLVVAALGGFIAYGRFVLRPR
jgi:hypothetical protein